MKYLDSTVNGFFFGSGFTVSAILIVLVMHKLFHIGLCS